MKEIRELKLSDKDLQEVYSWINTIQLSRPRRHLGWDFSDGRLAAEIIHKHKPTLFDLKNFPTVNAREYKLSNWEALSRKALRFINIELSAQDILDLVDGYPSSIENFLFVLKFKLENEPLVSGKSIERTKSTRSKTPERPRTPTKFKNTEIAQNISEDSLYVANLEKRIKELETELELRESGSIKDNKPKVEQRDIDILKNAMNEKSEFILKLQIRKKELENDLKDKEDQLLKKNLADSTDNNEQITKLERRVRDLYVEVKERDHIIVVQRQTIDLLNTELQQYKDIVLHH